TCALPILEYDRAYTSALKYISYKLRSVKELETHLSEYYEQKLVRQTVYRLQDEGYLNDKAYAEAFRNTVFNTSDKGPMHLVRELKKQGIRDRKSTRLNSSHVSISYAVFCLKKQRNE